MGLFDFLQKRLFKIGVASGSSFNNCFLANTTKNGKTAIKVFGSFGSFTEEFIFNKDDIKSYHILGYDVIFYIGDDRYRGVKYQITFKNGKSGVFTIGTDCNHVMEEILF